MNIAFDSMALLSSSSKNRGIGNYMRGLLKELMNQKSSENNYYFFNVIEDTDIFHEEVATNALKQINCILCNDGMFMNAINMENVYASALKHFLKDNKIDIFIITSPFDGSLPIYRQEWFEGIKTIAIVYDIIPYVMREHYLPNLMLYNTYLKYIDLLRWVDRLLVISQSVKDDLISYLDFSEDKIDVIWGAVNNNFGQLTITEQKKRKLFNKFKIDSHYIMCTGGDDYRKNIFGLISAYNMLPSELKKMYQLVIVCKIQDKSVKLYNNFIDECGLQGRVVFTNYVTDDELVQLYNLAELVVFPSKYEGFGLPVVEAWACGTAVVTSNNSSLVQIAGDGAIIVDPFSNESIAEGLKYALTSADLKELAKRGYNRLSLFTWKQVAERTTASFSNLKLDEKHNRKEYRKKIAWFSPLPPIQSGISDYSVGLIKKLSQYFDIDVFIDDGYNIMCELPDTVNCYLYNKYDAMSYQYMDTIYQMGNSSYHIYMWPYVRKYPGTLVLHDYNMREVYNYATLVGKTDFEILYEMISYDLSNEDCEKYILNIKEGKFEENSHVELNGYLTKCCPRIIVHDFKSKEKLLRADFGRLVEKISEYAEIGTQTNILDAKKILGIPENSIIFSAFGHVRKSKRIIPIINAFSRIIKDNKNIMLIFVGKISDELLENEFHELIRKYSIEEYVKVTGYTDLDIFNKYIDATDVCLNLRWPYNGETSGSLVRTLAKGKCVIVNDIGSFSEIADNACVKIPSVEFLSENEEVDAIYNAMKSLLNDEKLREQLQVNARKFAVENLDIDLIAKEYADFINANQIPIVKEETICELYEKINREKWPNKKIREIADALIYAQEYNPELFGQL